MNSNFDKTIKCMIEQESNHMSGEFKNTIKSVLEKLPEDDNGFKKVSINTRKIKVLLIASIVVLLLMATAFASSQLLEMTHNFLKYFNKIDNINIESKQSEYEKYNAPVNYTSESGGISITINNIAVDNNYFLITSTVTSPIPIKDIITESFLYKWEVEKFGIDDFTRHIFMIEPSYIFKIDGKALEDSHIVDWENYLETDYSFVTIQKYMIPDEISDIFHLDISASNVCKIAGNWTFDMMIDKSKTSGESIVATPNIQAKFTSIVQGAKYKHNIVVDKLSISPFGGQITISESGPEVFRDFTLRDENGNYYLVLNESVIFAENGDISKNVFEFIYPQKDEKVSELEIVPILTNGIPIEKQIMISDDNSPTEIKISDIGGYKTESIEIDEKKIKVTLKPYGAILQYRSIINGALGFLDINGSKEINKYISLTEVKYDKRNGNAVITGYWSKDVPGNILTQIGGFWYVEMPDMLLNEDEAIKIPLK